MLCGLPPMQQASICEGLSFGPLPFDDDSLAAPEVDVGVCEVTEALAVAQVIAVLCLEESYNAGQTEGRCCIGIPRIGIPRLCALRERWRRRC